VTARQALAIPIAYGAAFALGRLAYDSLPQVPGVVAGAAVATCVYSALLLVVGGTNERDRERFRQVRNALERRLRPSQPVTA
jgi:hypothetical protein